MRLQYSNGVLSIEMAGRMKEIGKINNRVLSVYLDQRRDWSAEHKAYGFIEAVMRDGRLFDLVEIQEFNGEYTDWFLVSRKDILSHGVVLNHDEYPKRIFISLDTLGRINQLKD